MVRLYGLTVGIASLGVTRAADQGGANSTLAESTVTASNVLYQLCGVDLQGGDIANKWSFTPDGCVQLCAGEPGCNSASWTNYDGGTCWLKRFANSWDAVPARPNADAVSFVSRPDVGEAMALSVYPLRDMRGHDFKNAPSPRYEDCARKCTSQVGCFAFTWTNYQGGTCWLKSRASAPVEDGGATSSMVAQRARGWGKCPP